MIFTVKGICMIFCGVCHEYCVMFQNLSTHFENVTSNIYVKVHVTYKLYHFFNDCLINSMLSKLNGNTTVHSESDQRIPQVEVYLNYVDREYIKLTTLAKASML